MLKRSRNNWRSRLQIVSCGLLILAAFAPVSETLQKILTAVAVVGMLVFLATDSPASRKESARFMVLLVASVLLALLLSVNPVWTAFAALAGSVLWELDRQEKAEDLAARKRAG
jgi:CHASE2 domain-containing sensor protein